MSGADSWQSENLAIVSANPEVVGSSAPGAASWNTLRRNTFNSPIINPESWPQLGNQGSKALKPEMHRQPSQSFDSALQQPETGGWVNHTTEKGGGNNTGWGNLPPQPSGWGNSDNGNGNWSRNQVDNGTSVWGKANQSGSNWAASPGTGWSAPPKPATQTVDISNQKSNFLPDQQQNSQISHPPGPNNPPNQPPESWAAAAKPSQSLPNISEQESCTEPESDQLQTQAPKSIEKNIDEVDDNMVDDPVHKLVNSHEGWGKRPVQQNTSWDITEAPNYTRQPSSKTGTEAWGKVSPNQAGGGWSEQNTEWQGNVDTIPQQWTKSPAGTQNVRGWGTANHAQQQQPRPWGAPTNSSAPQHSNWGGDHQMSHMPQMSPNRWSTPSNAAPNTLAQGWGNNQTVSNTAVGWPPADNTGWGMHRNTQTNNWPGRSSTSESRWNQQVGVPTHRMPCPVDDGTSAWGDPTAYKNVSLWDKKGPLGMNDNSTEANVDKPEPVGWGQPQPPNQGNWDQNKCLWGQGKSNNFPGWDESSGKPGQSWGQNDSSGWMQHPSKNELVGPRGSMEFGIVDRKTSTGSDSVFEEGQGDGNGQNIPIGISTSGRQGLNFGQYPVGQPNSQTAPRPVPPQSFMSHSNVPGTMMQGQVPPMPQHLQNQLQQIRHAVMKGVIPQRMLNPQLMTPRHVNLLQQLVMKTTELHQLQSRMSLLNKPNLPPQLRQQKEQTARMHQQCQQQIQAIQHALSQNMLQKSNQVQTKPNVGNSVSGSAGGLGLDVSAALPLTLNNPLNMSILAHNLPASASSTISNSNREQQSRLNTWKRPSISLNSPSDNISDHTGAPATINDILVDSGNLSAAVHSTELNSQSNGGRLLGLPNMNGETADAAIASNESHNKDSVELSKNVALHSETGGDDMVKELSHDLASPNLKNILDDIGPPEFIPGVKWKGFRPIDPENDPDITPGSVAIAKTMSVNTVKDVDQVLNRDRYANSHIGSPVSGSEITLDSQGHSLASSIANSTLNDNPSIASSTWSTATDSGVSSLSHTPTSLAHELWKVPLAKQSSHVNNRPQGNFPSQHLTNWSAGPSNSWSQSTANSGTMSRYSVPSAEENSGWAENKTWVVLTGLNPQMEFTALHQQCNSKGNMLSFQPNYPMRGMVLIRYSTCDEALGAQKSLNMSVMSGIMLVASIASDQEVSNFMTASSGNTWGPGGGQPRLATRNSFGSSGTLLSNQQQPSHSHSGQFLHASSSTGDMQRFWSSRGSALPVSSSWSRGDNASGNLFRSGTSGGYEDSARMMSPLHSLLPENLLGEQTM